ncbi:hypothetical protein FG93_01200 [Bosea sp. LC85]|uniref:hypothetical protein n=1 Tax=Bosea sp. LC85 TaxID=1502851 RepID=UPI0004E37F15|nr:hypothetical protein [Bosea sp. LC85]KFC74322.1 hypothetical protein FG93_01200 [Bosea sp. LC85]
MTATTRIWWHRPLLRFEVRELWLLGARNDLALDAEIAETLSLDAGRRLTAP